MPHTGAFTLTINNVYLILMPFIFTLDTSQSTDLFHHYIYQFRPAVTFCKPEI